MIAESEPLELSSSSPSSPSAVRPALALTAAEEVETIRRVLLEAATSTTRENGLPAPVRSVGRASAGDLRPDHGAWIKAIETLLREGLGRVGESEVTELRMPTTADEVKNLSWDDLNLVFALTHATEIRAVVDNGDDALRSELESMGPETRAALARVPAEVG